jgi:predicted enzyme related to lactoylglutathione lyase
MTNKPPAFRLAGFVLLVSDIERSKRFYQDLFGQEIAMDVGLNVGFTSGLALWQRDYALTVIHGKAVESRMGNDVEIYFETEEIDEVWEMIRARDIAIVHEIREQPWCQRVFRVYDPDQFVVEVAEPMDAVVRRLQKADHSEAEIVQKTMMPAAIVRAILG